jgi:hypothetical protein
MVRIMHGICLTLSLRLLIPRPRRTASTQTTASPSVPLGMFADSSAQMDSRLPRLIGRLRVHATRLRSSVTVSAWLQGYAPRVLQLAGRGLGLAATLAQRWDLRGQPAASLVVVLVRGSASTLLTILKAVSACRLCASLPLLAAIKLTDLLLPQKKVVAARTLLRLTLPLARTARRSLASPMSPVCRASASSAAAYPDTCPRSVARAASANIPLCNLNLLIRRTCLRGSMDSSTFPLEGTEFCLCHHPLVPPL